MLKDRQEKLCKQGISDSLRAKTLAELRGKAVQCLLGQTPKLKYEPEKEVKDSLKERNYANGVYILCVLLSCFAEPKTNYHPGGQ